MDFIALYSIEVAIVSPIVARRGEILCVWPASPTHTVGVCSTAPGYPVLRQYAIAVGALYGIVLMWEADGIIAPLSAGSALFAQRTA